MKMYKIIIVFLTCITLSFSNTLTQQELYEQNFSINKGAFKIIEFDKMVKNIKVSSQEFIDVDFLKTKANPLKGIKIFAKAIGNGNILVTFNDGTPMHININIVENLTTAIAVAKEISPNLEVTQTNGKIILKGNVQEQKTKDVIINLFKKANIELENQLIDLTIVKNPDKMVRIKLYVVQIDNSKQLSIKNDWSLLGFDDGRTSAQAIFKSSTSISGGLTAIANRVGSRFNVGLTLQYLKTQEIAEILDETTLITLEDNESKFHSGGTINARVATGDTIQFTQIEYGLKMAINVQEIIDGKYVKLLVDTESSTIDDKVERVDNIPAIKNKTIQTNVVVGNLSTVVLGGLINIGNTQYEEKIPLLGDIPVLGKLFTTSRDTKDNKELVFFITPEIVDPTNNNDQELFKTKTEFINELDLKFDDEKKKSQSKKAQESVSDSNENMLTPQEEKLKSFLGY